MENLPVKQETALPRIEELYSDVDMAIKETKLAELLNCPPQTAWIREHPIAKKEVTISGNKVKVPMLYIPIERLEWLAIRLFGGYRVEVRNFQLIANSIAVSVRVFVKNPLTGEEMYQDGVGAMNLQVNQGAQATDWTQVKSAAVQMALPAAKTYAEKDALENFGKIFGRDINRDGSVFFDNLSSKFQNTKEAREKISEALEHVQDLDMKQAYIDRLTLKESRKEATIEFYAEILMEIENGR
jgi:hypothetical protein